MFFGLFFRDFPGEAFPSTTAPRDMGFPVWRGETLEEFAFEMVSFPLAATLT